jgi:hypothetical protein
MVFNRRRGEDRIPLRNNLPGKVWYFLCPNTGKHCWKLYMINAYFLHRSGFRGAMYEKQTYSKNARQQFKLWGKLFDIDKVYEQLYSKHFKKQYAGKPTI